MTLLNGLSLDRNEIMKKVAAVIHDYMEIPVEKILEGTSFSELDSKFDSLALFEIRMALEKEFNFEAEEGDRDEPPANIHELTDELMAQLTGQMKKTNTTITPPQE